MHLMGMYPRETWHAPHGHVRKRNLACTPQAEFSSTQYAGLLRTRPDLAQLCFEQVGTEQAGQRAGQGFGQA